MLIGLVTANVFNIDVAASNAGIITALVKKHLPYACSQDTWYSPCFKRKTPGCLVPPDSLT